MKEPTSTRRAAILSALFATFGNAAWSRTKPQPTGAYMSAGQPRVFTNVPELRALAQRTSVRDSYSAQRFGHLAQRVATDLKAGIAWDAAYAGNVLDVYLYAFSYEPQDAGQTAMLRKSLDLPAGTPPPAGAALVSARLALYAALAQAGASLPPSAPSPEQSIALAKRILLAWTERGFRDAKGHFLSRPAQFANPDGTVDAGSMSAVGLQVSRGIVYSAQAHDLLTYLDALNESQMSSSIGFHTAMYELVRQALNYRLLEYKDWECNLYSNHLASQLAGLLATSRLINDKARFEAALHGEDQDLFVASPWIAYFDKAIYGSGEAPHACYPNSGPNGPTSHPSFQTAVVAPGEIDDRYRNANPLQGIGYPMFTLQWLYISAEILRLAGIDVYGYHGRAGQTIKEATQFYAAYAKAAGFGQMVTEANAANCAGSAQYIGKLVNGVDPIILAAAARFPDTIAFTELESSARAVAARGEFSTDAVMFGLWRG